MASDLTSAMEFCFSLGHAKMVSVDGREVVIFLPEALKRDYDNRKKITELLDEIVKLNERNKVLAFQLDNASSETAKLKKECRDLRARHPVSQLSHTQDHAIRAQERKRRIQAELLSSEYKRLYEEQLKSAVKDAERYNTLIQMVNEVKTKNRTLQNQLNSFKNPDTSVCAPDFESMHSLEFEMEAEGEMFHSNYSTPVSNTQIPRSSHEHFENEEVDTDFCAWKSDTSEKNRKTWSIENSENLPEWCESPINCVKTKV